MGVHRSPRQGWPHPDGGGPHLGQAGHRNLDHCGQHRQSKLLRPLSKSGKIVGDELGDWAIWSIVEQSSKQMGIEHFGAHDLRRTCAKLRRKNGGDLEQIKFCSVARRIRPREGYLGPKEISASGGTPKSEYIALTISSAVSAISGSFKASRKVGWPIPRSSASFPSTSLSPALNFAVMMASRIAWAAT